MLCYNIVVGLLGVEFYAPFEEVMSGLARLSTLSPRISTLDTRTVRPLPKQADAELQTEAHKAWRLQVLNRAGWKCEACGKHGGKGHGAVRLFADHIIERRDGGALLDPANGRCLCGSCHSTKTAKERAKRMHDRHSVGEG